MGWPGLSQEVKQICKAIGIDNINEKEVEIKEIKEAIFYHNYKEMKEKMMDLKKLENVRNGNFTKEQEYMSDKSIETARLTYRVRTKLVPKIRGNFPNLYKRDLQCRDCSTGQDMTQEHVEVCPAWDSLREGLDLYRLTDVVKYFTEILKEKEDE